VQQGFPGGRLSVLTCSRCDSPAPASARFCPECGGPLRTDTPTADGLRQRLQTAVEGTFRIERLLGRGGMGAVYLAREPALDRQVAIKVLPPERAQSADLRERFRREARTAAQLSHPHIVPLLTFGESDGLVYFVMGYVDGETLSSRLQREGPLAIAEAVRVLTELAQALSYAHGRAVVHRDVKPDNVLLEQPRGLVRLTDFGIAKQYAGRPSLTAEGAVIGTPLYMSPEQASGRTDLDARTDIYSLGAVAFTIFSGRPPFEGRNSSEIMRQHLTSEAPRLRDVVPGIPGAVDEAVQRCLAKEPSARWRDPVEFSNALNDAGDSWWSTFVRRARPVFTRQASPASGPLDSASTPSPSSPSDFRAALLGLAERLTDLSLAARARATASRLADQAEALDRRLIGLQMASDLIELKRTDKRIASLREIPEPSPEVLATIASLSQLRSASQTAADKVHETRSVRASVLAELRRLYSALRRAVAAADNAAARADLDALCDDAADRASSSEGDGHAETQTRTR
jgi:serine/threonine protein kinase